MMLEKAELIVKEELLAQFEADFRKASQYIASAKGDIQHSLQKCIEQENKFLLLVEWASLEDHTIGFRQSENYLEWKKLLHHYYDPFPVVEHFQTIFETKKKAI